MLRRPTFYLNRSTRRIRLAVLLPLLLCVLQLGLLTHAIEHLFHSDGVPCIACSAADRLDQVPEPTLPHLAGSSAETEADRRFTRLLIDELFQDFLARAPPPSLLT